MNQSFYKLWSLYIASLIIFTIFDLISLCSGQQFVQSKSFINNTQQQTIKSPLPTGNPNTGSHDYPQALQLHKLYVLTLTSNYVVTQTATSYSYSSSTTTISNSISSTPTGSNSSSSSSVSKDTSILIGSLVGGIGGLLVIGTGLFVFIQKRSSKKDLFDQQQDNEYGFDRNSHMRAFVPPLVQNHTSTPTLSLDASSSQQHYQLHGHPYNTSDSLLQQQDTSLDTNDRHVPNEDDQMVAVQERHVPHLVD